MAEQAGEDAWLLSVSKILTCKAMVQIGAEYMGFNVTQLLIILDDANNDVGKAKINALTEFKNRQDHPKQVS